MQFSIFLQCIFRDPHLHPPAPPRLTVLAPTLPAQSNVKPGNANLRTSPTPFPSVPPPPSSSRGSRAPTPSPSPPARPPPRFGCWAYHPTLWVVCALRAAAAAHALPMHAVCVCGSDRGVLVDGSVVDGRAGGDHWLPAITLPLFTKTQTSFVLDGVKPFCGTRQGSVPPPPSSPSGVRDGVPAATRRPMHPSHCAQGGRGPRFLSVSDGKEADHWNAPLKRKSDDSNPDPQPQHTTGRIRQVPPPQCTQSVDATQNPQ